MASQTLSGQKTAPIYLAPTADEAVSEEDRDFHPKPCRRE
jgi:hypothetical protein